ncbi:hypothetical protein ANTPLA_LOCUS1242 [Anthophora plagiata]
MVPQQVKRFAVLIVNEILRVHGTHGKNVKNTRDEKKTGRRPYDTECFPKPSKDGGLHDLRITGYPSIMFLHNLNCL